MGEVSPTLESRVEQMERLNRRQRWLLLGLPAITLLLGASAAQVADWKGKSVTTEKLILVDGDGKERGVWYVHKGEPVLELYKRGPLAHPERRQVARQQSRVHSILRRQRQV